MEIKFCRLVVINILTCLDSVVDISENILTNKAITNKLSDYPSFPENFQEIRNKQSDYLCFPGN